MFGEYIPIFRPAVWSQARQIGFIMRAVFDLENETRQRPSMVSVVCYEQGGKAVPLRIYPGTIAFILLSSFCITAQSVQPAATSQHLIQSLAALPLGFEENQGQIDENARFVLRASSYSAYLSRGELLVAFDSRNNAQKDGEIVRIGCVRADKRIEPQGNDLLPGVMNYYLGNDPEKWRTNIRQYRQVRYRDIYPHVGLVFYGNRLQLEFDFNVEPGGDVSHIALKVEGATVTERKGDLVLTTPSGNVAVLKRPELYQGEGRARHRISGGYTVRSADEVGFTVGRYDKRKPLVIDPALVYSTLADLDMGARTPFAVALDNTAAAYIIGQLPNSTVFVASFYPPDSTLSHYTPPTSPPPPILTRPFSTTSI